MNKLIVVNFRYSNIKKKVRQIYFDVFKLATQSWKNHTTPQNNEKGF
jgi:hypothetical protein